MTRFGPLPSPSGTTFRLWAPDHESVTLLVEGAQTPMERGAGGLWSLATDHGPGTLYRFGLPDGAAIPDPASRFQPEGVHGPSEVIARPSPAPFERRPWHETVLYEMHVGSFTEDGTYRAAIGHLDHLAETGFTALELMPLSAFAGRWGWGYDGVMPFAPHAAYGRPEDLVALVDACHERGLMIFLDVVYNHFGPEGAYIHGAAPAAFDPGTPTPWGPAIDYAGPMRDFAAENVLMWVRDYGFDGLRFDAVDHIRDDSERHILTEMAERAREAVPGVHLVLENDLNDAGRLRPAGPYDAQWADDLHHCLHVAVTGEDEGYYGAYARRPDLLARALAEGFAYQGEVPTGRGAPRGRPSAHLSPARFVAFLQNHDQVGNRLLSERIHHDAGPDAVEAALGVLLLAPHVPLMFMGEEWATSSPFPFFCDFEGELAEKVRVGRAEEFSHFPNFVQAREAGVLPDPTDPRTFEDAKLDWAEPLMGVHAARLKTVSELLRLRAAHVTPLIPQIERGGTHELSEGWGMRVVWRAGERALTLDCNLSDVPARAVSRASGKALWSRGETGATLGPWSVLWSLR